MGICDQQYCFMPRDRTTDAVFALRLLTEKYRNGQRTWQFAFEDLKKKAQGAEKRSVVLYEVIWSDKEACQSTGQVSEL